MSSKFKLSLIKWKSIALLKLQLSPTFVSVVNSSVCGKLAHTSSGMDPGICPLIVFADFARMHMEVLILDERSLLHKWYFISARS